MKTSAQGIDLLKHLEAVRRTAYRDEKGKLTIGVGHLLTPSELRDGSIMIGDVAVPWSEGLTDSQVEQLLEQDLVRFEDAVNGLSLALHQHQFDALVCFVFNVGEGRDGFGGSTLRRKLQTLAELIEDVVKVELPRWNKVAGKVSNGQIRRRNAEVQRFTEGTA